MNANSIKIKVSKKLDKLASQVLFPEKLKAANETLRNTVLPKK